MILTVHHTHDILQLLCAVSEELILNDSAEFKRISHIAKFFVTKFFAKIIRILKPAKLLITTNKIWGKLMTPINKIRKNC